MKQQFKPQKSNVNKFERQKKMSRQKIREMLSDIISEIDYDIWKESYNEDTAEEPELVEANFECLIPIVEKYL